MNSLAEELAALRYALFDSHEQVLAYERELKMPHSIFKDCPGCAYLAEHPVSEHDRV